MSGSGWLYYATTLLVYGGIDAIACIGLSMQFGIAGVTNFGFILYQAAGAYAAAVLSMPSDRANGGFQRYVGGLHLPFPIPWLGAALVGGVLSVPLGLIVGRKLRSDYAAIAMLVTAIIVNSLVTNYRPFLNGAAGLALVPPPFSGELDPNGRLYQWLYSAAAIVLAFLIYLMARRITESPYGRTLRAMRDNADAAEAMGKNVRMLRISVLFVGGVIAGLSGAVLVGFITTWSPATWGYTETIVLFAALIVGGLGNHKGAVLGAVLVPLGFEEATRFIPSFGPPNLVPALEWCAVGSLILLFLWFRPQGVLPERRRHAPSLGGSHLQDAISAEASHGL